MTNATKALIIAAVNAVIGLATAFGVALTAVQTGSILATANAFLALYVAYTYKNSAKRVPGA